MKILLQQIKKKKNLTASTNKHNNLNINSSNSNNSSNKNNKNNKDEPNISLNLNQISFIKDIKNEGNKNNLFKSYNFNDAKNSNELNTKKEDTSYILLSYSKNNKTNKINKSNYKYNQSTRDKNKICNVYLKGSSNNYPSKNNNYNSHHNTILDISTNYDPNIDSRNSSIEKSFSANKKDIRNFSYSPSQGKNKKQEINLIKKGQIVNVTKKNKNFNSISEDDEFKIKSKEKKRKNIQFCQKKVTINLSLNTVDKNNINKKGTSKLKKIITKKK